MTRYLRTACIQNTSDKQTHTATYNRVRLEGRMARLSRGHGSAVVGRFALGASVSAFCVMFTAACGPDISAADDLTTTEGSHAALAAEVPSGVAEVITTQYRTDPNVTRASFAMANLDNCSASMIGPNILLTAAHCGAVETRTARFRTYRDGVGTKNSDSETFSCRFLVQTFKDTDLQLYYCDSNASGEAPGIKYGYLDLDAKTKLSVGQSVYSVWSNNLTTAGTTASWARIYSKGTVTSVTKAGWYAPDAQGDIGVETSTWTVGGASGSPQLNPNNHRILIGPTSTGGNGTDVGSPLRNALSIRDYLTFGLVGDATSSKSAANLQALGLGPNDYVGAVDKDKNDMFDVQEDVEQVTGEPARDWYWLGFESERRNALWTPKGSSFAGFSPEGGWARIKRDSASGLMVAIEHAKLNLKPSTSYRVSLMVQMITATAGSKLVMRLVDSSGQALTSHTITPGTPGDWGTYTFSLKTPAASPARLWILTDGGPMDVRIGALGLVEPGAVMNFDTHDKRVAWKNGDTGANASIVPDGVVSKAGSPNWAGRVTRDWTCDGCAAENFSLRNRQLALAAGAKYQVCFTTKHDPAHGMASSMMGRVMLQSADQTVLSQGFSLSHTWTKHCFVSSTLPTSENTLRFGATGALAGAPVEAGFAYLVDDITILPAK